MIIDEEYEVKSTIEKLQEMNEKIKTKYKDLTEYSIQKDFDEDIKNLPAEYRSSI